MKALHKVLHALGLHQHKTVRKAKASRTTARKGKVARAAVKSTRKVARKTTERKTVTKRKRR